MTIIELIDSASKFLRQQGITTDRMDAKLILSEVTGYSSETIYLNSADSLTSDQLERFESLINERAQYKPIAYILGYKEFYGYKFFVSQDTLIPRPDSEIMIDAILKSYDSNSKLNILDLGTGTGCLIMSLLLQRPKWQGVAVELYQPTINIAMRNQKFHKLQKRLVVEQSSWFSALDPSNQFDVIISNPPYVSYDEVGDLANETLKYEPHRALFADNDGLKCYKVIAQQAQKFLKPKAKIFVEIGYKQKEEVIAIFAAEKFICTESFQDLSGLDRCLVFKYIL